jgi:Tfp pilus assembly protein PilX
MEQLISRRLPARRAQSGVALIMVLIMLTAMAIAGVALVRVVDSANVISGNFAFRQSTLNIADLGVEAAAADLAAIPPPPKVHRGQLAAPSTAATSPSGRSTCPT